MSAIVFEIYLLFVVFLSISFLILKDLFINKNKVSEIKNILIPAAKKYSINFFLKEGFSWEISNRYWNFLPEYNLFRNHFNPTLSLSYLNIYITMKKITNLDVNYRVDENLINKIIKIYKN